MLLWFGTLSVLGISALINEPSILAALTPMEAIHFFFTHKLHTRLLPMGSVMLVITGGEAMFADMGHFGRLPIRISWYTIAYPALVLNYFGQGAYLLSEKAVNANNVFYSMVPSALLPAVVILATCATIIASQAMISGAFSLTKQAISLRLLPYIPTIYTHKDHEGQIYIPAINWMLYAGAVLLVIIFQSSSRLAGAYGLAVAGDMLITTLAMMAIAIALWKWNRLFVYVFFGAFLLVDLTFLSANTLKLFEGGYIPLTVGFIMFGVIQIWQWGRRHTAKAFEAYKCMTVKDLVRIQNTTEQDIPRTVVFLNRYAISSLDQEIPVQAQLFYEKHGMLPQHLVFLTVDLLKTPHAKERFEVNQLTPTKQKNGTITSIIVKFGFMEDPDLEPLLTKFIKHEDIPSTDPIDHWEFRVLYEKINMPQKCSTFCKLKFALYSFIHKLSYTTDHYLGLGRKAHCTIDILR
jgi:KUP system potassium uptake protein